MDYAEQIEVYFDRYQDESDELNDFQEPPIRLHKFVQFCQNTAYTIPTNDIYHWFVACTWFYHQNRLIFNNKEFNLDDIIISNSFIKDFKNYLNKNHQNIKSHTKKQIIHLYRTHDQQIEQFLYDIIEIFFVAENNDNHDNHKKDYLSQIWYETSLISCIESSFASIIAARYSLLRSIYITFLYIFYEEEQFMNDETQNIMHQLLDLLKGYFILSYLSSAIYQTKQYLGINTRNSSNITSTQKQQQLLANLQSSFRSGLVVRHYLRYWYNQHPSPSNISNSYFISPLQYIRELTLFNYLLARCYIEMNQNKNNGNTTNKEMDQYVVNLINECCRYLQKASIANNDKEKCLLGLILTNDSWTINNIDIYHLAPRDSIEFPKEFIVERETKKKRRSSSCFIIKSIII